MNLNVFLYEAIHFTRSKAKLYSYIFFMCICILSIFNAYKISNKQTQTILNINEEKEIENQKVIDWFDKSNKGPDDKSWINVEDPYWAIRSTSTYVVKEPSPLMLLGIGQSTQFGFYKKVNRWSSTFDDDIVEEISNYERLINGNIDFSFLIIFLLPVLIIIMTYNINGLEKDFGFHKLISIQNNQVKIWIFTRFLFYLILVLFSVNILILTVGFFNCGISNIKSVLSLILLSNLYIILFFVVFYFLNRNGNSSSSIAFKMISVWLLFCVIIPGSVHQYVSFQYPVNYMTDFLDVNRKKTYDIFKLDNSNLYTRLLDIHPEISPNKDSLEINLENKKIRRSISSIVNKMNVDATNEIERQNEEKNRLVRFTYIFNPISYVQNMWNSCTSTDYNSYKKFRVKIKESIQLRNELLVLEMWKEQKVDKESYQEYLKVLN